MNTAAGTQSRASPLRFLSFLAAAVLGAAMSILPATPTPTASAADDVKLANALTEASMVYVQVQWTGYLVNTQPIQITANTYIAPGVRGPVEAVTSCSGFVASPNGDIVTAGHCVDAESFEGGKGALLDATLPLWKDEYGQPLSESEMASLREILRANADIEGKDSGSPPERAVQVTVPASSSESVPANVVEVQPFDQGDVALLRATGITAPTLPLADTAPETGDAVVAAGYSGSVAEVVDGTTPVSFKEGSISGSQTVNGAPFTEISAEVSPGMSGGPVVNMQGEVVGTVSWAPTGTKAAANFITDVGSIEALLAGNGVESTLSKADQAYRQGLTYYFARRYHDAVEQFDQVLALQPGLKLATEYRQKAIVNYPNDVNPPSSGLPWWAYLGIGTAVVAVAGGAGFYLIRRRRAGPPPVPPTPAPEAPTPIPEGLTPASEAPTPASGVPAGIGVGPPPSSATVTPTLPRQATPTAADARGTVEVQAHHYCPNCGTEHAAETHYCEQCGQPFAAAHPEMHEGR